MAKITVTTDQGEVLLIMSDANGDLGDLSRQHNRSAFVDEIQYHVKLARTHHDGRVPETGDTRGAR